MYMFLESFDDLLLLELYRVFRHMKAHAVELVQAGSRTFLRLPWSIEQLPTSASWFLNLTSDFEN